MTDVDPRQREAIALRHAGRCEDALALLQALFAEVEREAAPDRSRYFMPMFEWRMLAEEYAPARAALAHLREAQAARLLAGDLYGGSGDRVVPEDHIPRRTRFLIVVEINRILGDALATHALFVRLDAAQPELARRYAWLALPDIVEAGDFLLADRYRRDPLERLDEVNRVARSLPLIAPAGAAPRLAGDLMNLTADVQIGMAVLRGLGKDAEALALRGALLAGLESSDVRALAEREMEAPGTINRELVARQITQEGR